MTYYCPKCGNKNLEMFGLKNGKIYCRKCINFKTDKPIKYQPLERREIKPTLKYQLSKEQMIISKNLLKEFKKHNNSLVHAVCGAGKTEIVLDVITYAIIQGFRVGFAIPRKDVVIELYGRFKNIFPTLKIISIYGGNTSILEGDFLILTTHQLFRYEKYFDLLVVDEIDAFPFHGSDILMHQLKNSVRGNYVYMSATPPEKILKEFKESGNKIFKLFTRFHRKPLPVPKVKEIFSPFNYLYLIFILRKFTKSNKPVFVFAPTISICKRVYFIISKFISSVNIVHSKHPDRNKIIEQFKKGKIKTLITTAVLERGVTIKDLQVVIFNADHYLYDSSSLIQISGRAGRKIDAPGGEVIFICEKSNRDIEKCIEEIKKANTDLQAMLSKYKLK